MSERKEHAYGFTLDGQEGHTDEDLQKKMLNAVRALDRAAQEDGWSYCIEWVVSDVSYTKLKGFIDFGIELDAGDIERTPWHVHGNLYATAGATAWKIIKEYWTNNVNEDKKAKDLKKLNECRWRGWFDYVEGNRKYSSRSKVYARASKDFKGKKVADIAVERGLLV